MKKKSIYIVSLIILLAALSMLSYAYLMTSYSGNESRVLIHDNATKEDIRAALVDSLGSRFGEKVYRIWELRGGSIKRAHGSYLVKTGETVFSVARRLRGGMQNDVRVVVPNVRSSQKAIDAISSELEFSSIDLAEALDSALESRGLKAEALPAILLPDTYRFYWTSKPSYVVRELMNNYDRFWTEERLAKAQKLNLSPVQVATLASIVEEESAKADERPVIARLYLNRLERHMRLQADPTVKYAVGDPAMRRILKQHLSTQSPYNTYLVDGLPPGPIRLTDKSTLNAVLDAPVNNYIYMCAREDFSGYHNFATTLEQHNVNAQKYHRALNKKNILK